MVLAKANPKSMHALSHWQACPTPASTSAGQRPLAATLDPVLNSNHPATLAPEHAPPALPRRVARRGTAVPRFVAR